MKSLNDSLREEFAEILKEPEMLEMVKFRNLDPTIIQRAFEKLLDNKYSSDDNSSIDKGRADFETYIINTLKTKRH